jgi:hypothetical protein
MGAEQALLGTGRKVAIRPRPINARFTIKSNQTELI